MNFLPFDVTAPSLAPSVCDVARGCHGLVPRLQRLRQTCKPVQRQPAPNDSVRGVAGLTCRADDPSALGAEHALCAACAVQIDARFCKMRDSATHFMLLQYGISTFKWNEETKVCVAVNVRRGGFLFFDWPCNAVTPASTLPLSCLLAPVPYPSSVESKAYSFNIMPHSSGEELEPVFSVQVRFYTTVGFSACLHPSRRRRGVCVRASAQPSGVIAPIPVGARLQL